MSAITTNLNAAPAASYQNERMPFLLQVTTMTWRSLLVVSRKPAEVIPGIMISIFFLFVYQASLGNAASFLPGLAGKSYLAFILPVSIVSSALSGAGLAGFAIVRDIERGYFDKLLLTPISRVALLLGPVFAGALVLGLQAAIVLLVGVLLGLSSATGIAGILVVLGMSILLGTAFAGFTIGIALRTGSAGATQGASFLFFPLTFLTATFVPVNLLSGWIRVAADYNPITYVLGAMRGVLLDGWNADVLVKGVIACAIMGVVTFAFALTSLQARVKQK
ncbi:MAG: ABC transporter permease [Anaerolineae bacterium]|nr:ABC transporter permease [Anaerolineae bacterium]